MALIECSSHVPKRMWMHPTPAHHAIWPASPAGRTRHAPRADLPRHSHDHGFVAIVLSGGYVEAGDTGRHRMEPGDVLLHRAWESHLDRFDSRGAEVLVLATDVPATSAVRGRIDDVDAIVRLVEDDPDEAARQLLGPLGPIPAAADDWPDMLARAMRENPFLSLSAWASAFGLHLGSLSRGFGQVFGITPVGYRLAQRTHRAINALLLTEEPLSRVAIDCGFSDQAHMCREIGRVAQATPGLLRRRGRGMARR
jgi:AraC-like DNA-binding protein